MRIVLAEASPDSIPAWFLDWYAMRMARRAVWQMLSIALCAGEADRCARRCPSCSGSARRRHGLRLGGYRMRRKWLSAADMAKGSPARDSKGERGDAGWVRYNVNA